MKSYTDLEQSKTLEKILPLESADMHYRDWKRMTKNIRIAHVGSGEIGDLPCWSLTALMDVLDRGALFKTPQGWVYHSYVESAAIISNYHSNPIDACVAMIEKLHEQKLL